MVYNLQNTESLIFHAVHLKYNTVNHLYFIKKKRWSMNFNFEKFQSHV